MPRSPQHPGRSDPCVWAVVLIATGVLVVASVVDAQNAAPKSDAYGDPLPKGALARLGSLRFRHEAGVSSQAASPDGKWLASGGGRTVRLWDAATGKQVHLFSFNAGGGRTIVPNALAFSPDGKYLAALGSVTQGLVTVWDVNQGQQRHQFSLPPREENAGGNVRLGLSEDVPLLAFTANGGMLVKNFGDRAVRLFDLESGQELRTFQDAGSQLTTVACSPDGTLLATGTDARHVILWEVATGKEARRLPHDYGLVSLAFSPDGRTLATLDQDLSPMLWDVKTGVQQMTLPARTRSVALAFTHDGQSLLVARQPDEILSWDLKTKQEHQQRLPKTWIVTTMSSLSVTPTPSAPGGSRLLLGPVGRRSNVAKLRFVELTRGQPQPSRFDGYESGNVHPFYLAAVRQWASIGTSGDDTVRLWDAEGRIARTFRLTIMDQQPTSFALASDGRRFCLGCRDGRVYVVDGVEGKLLYQIQAFQKPCADIAVTADGRFLLANDLRTAKVFDVATGKEIKSYELHSFDCLRVQISSDGSRLVALAYNQDDDQPLLRIYDAPTGKVLSETRTALQQNNFSLSSDGRSLIFLGNNRGGRGGNLSVVEVASGKPRLQVELPNPYSYVGNHARISPDGRWLVASGNGLEAEQYAALAWRLGEKPEHVILQGHRGSLVSVNFSTDARQLLTLSSDSTMVTWDMTSLGARSTAPRRDVKDLQELWTDLNDADAAKAFTVIHQLAAQPDAAPWLARQLGTEIQSPGPDRVRELIDRLDAPKFSDRQQASDELIRLGNAVAPLLRDAVAADLSPEVKGRLQKILDKAQETSGLGGISLLVTRAIEAIELAGTPVALLELNRLAARMDSLGSEARAAALRLKQRVGQVGSAVGATP